MRKKIIFGTSDAWLISRSSHRPSNPAYYIEDCRISSEYFGPPQQKQDGAGIIHSVLSSIYFP